MKHIRVKTYLDTINSVNEQQSHKVFRPFQFILKDDHLDNSLKNFQQYLKSEQLL